MCGTSFNTILTKKAFLALFINHLEIVLKFIFSMYVLLQNGNVACSPLPCPALSCRNPVHRAGDCCPR